MTVPGPFTMSQQAQNDFRIARRYTYLAERAVENEFQQSMALRGAVLAART